MLLPGRQFNHLPSPETPRCPKAANTYGQKLAYTPSSTERRASWVNCHLKMHDKMQGEGNQSDRNGPHKLGIMANLPVFPVQTNKKDKQPIWLARLSNISTVETDVAVNSVLRPRQRHFTKLKRKKKKNAMDRGINHTGVTGLYTGAVNAAES